MKLSVFMTSIVISSIAILSFMYLPELSFLLYLISGIVAVILVLDLFLYRTRHLLGERAKSFVPPNPNFYELISVYMFALGAVLLIQAGSVIYGTICATIFLMQLLYLSIVWVMVYMEQSK